LVMRWLAPTSEMAAPQRGQLFFHPLSLDNYADAT
jgi:hypothetical protein